MKESVKLSNLTQGRTLYSVCYPSSNLVKPFMEVFLVESRPYPVYSKYFDNSYFTDVSYYNTIAKKRITRSISLCDENIYPFKNWCGAKHKSFYKRKAAENYLKKCLDEYYSYKT